MHALGLEFGSVAQLSKRPGSVWNCLWGNALKRSPGIIRKSRVSYPGPGFLSSATWFSLPKKHYNGLNQYIYIYTIYIYIYNIYIYIYIYIYKYIYIYIYYIYIYIYIYIIPRNNSIPTYIQIHTSHIYIIQYAPTNTHTPIVYQLIDKYIYYSDFSVSKTM